jgi:hypothetical protein
MDQYYEGIKKGEYNLVLLDQNGTQVFSATASPVTKLSQLIVRGLLPDEYTVYTTQLGLALATVSRMIKIKKIIAVPFRSRQRVARCVRRGLHGGSGLYLSRIQKIPTRYAVLKKRCSDGYRAERIAFIASKGKESAPSCPVK